METYQIQFGERLVGVPWWWFDALLAWLGLMGIVLWLFGKPLIKPVAAVAGLVFGAIAATAIVTAIVPDFSPLPFAVGSAMVFAILGWLLWRLWLGFGLASLLVVTSAAVIVAASGLSFEPLPDAVATSVNEVRAAYGLDVTVTSDTDSPDTAATPDDASADPPAAQPAGDNGPEGDTGEPGDAASAAPTAPKWEELRENAAAPLRDGFNTWWEATSAGQAALLISVTAAAAMLGLILGIIFPNFSGPLVIAAVGVDLMLGGTLRLLAWLTPDAYTSIITAGPYLVFGLLAVTLLGATMQWVLYRKKSKDEDD